MRPNDLITCGDLAPEDFGEIFEVARIMKESHKRGEDYPALQGKTLGMIFEKPSMRTRISFEAAMTQMGGHAIYLTRQDIRLGERESIKDGARVFARYVDAIVIRTYGHDMVIELAKYADVPVINALSDYLHPCQALADLFTLLELKEQLEGLRLAFVGDGNNVARSLAVTCSKTGVQFSIASPEGYEFTPEFMADLQAWGGDASKIRSFRDPKEAVADADAVYTDSWISMGQEEEAEIRKKVFQPYQLNASLLAHARPDALVMHCLPAHRGFEITDEVIDGPQSIVYDEAENRMHVQKAVLKLLLQKEKRGSA